MHTEHRTPVSSPGWFIEADRPTNERLARRVVWIVTLLLAVNQLVIASLMPASATVSPASVVKSVLGINSASAQTIIAPQMNADGKTTTLVVQPTITEVHANPKSGDDLADAKVVMQAVGVPSYAPDGVTFDDPVDAEKLWGAYENAALTGELLTRYEGLVDTLPCSYCCGSASAVTRNRQCGCAHAKAARGFFKYLLQTYGDQYSDAELLGEQFRWQALWYPKGAIEDYLLAIGKGSVVGHSSHGGAGSDGNHGLSI